MKIIMALIQALVIVFWVAGTLSLLVFATKGETALLAQTLDLFDFKLFVVTCLVGIYTILEDK